MLRECPSIRLRILHTPGLMQSSPRCVPSVQLLGGIAFLLCSLNAIAVSSGERFTPIAKITEGMTTTRNRGILAFRPPSPSSYELLRHHRSTYPESRRAGDTSSTPLYSYHGALRKPSPRCLLAVRGNYRSARACRGLQLCSSSDHPVDGGGGGGWDGGWGGGGEDCALLLRMDFEQANVEELRHWIRRYPFGTTLPVQPFSLVETEKGLDLIFRKKPTLERGSQDGGLSFVVEESSARGQDDGIMRPTLVLRRISEGQEIRKIFAERIVVKAMVKCLVGDGAPPAPLGTKARAVLHEGLV